MKSEVQQIYFNPTEAAKRLGISRSKFIRLAAAHSLTPKWIGNSMAFHVDQLESLVTEEKRPGVVQFKLYAKPNPNARALP